MGYINCHPSLLPYYRGGAPYFHIVNNGEKESGITLHFMDETFDTGDIIYQKKFNLMQNETMGSLFNRTNYMLSDALIEILTKIENKEEIKRIKQDKNKKYPTAELVGGNFRIRWNSQNIFKIERLIRASNPFYNTFTSFRDTNFKIIQAKAYKHEHNFKPGRIVKVDDNKLVIAGIDGFLSLEIFQIGTWGIYTPKEFREIFNPSTDEFLV